MHPPSSASRAACILECLICGDLPFDWGIFPLSSLPLSLSLPLSRGSLWVSGVTAAGGGRESPPRRLQRVRVQSGTHAQLVNLDHHTRITHLSNIWWKFLSSWRLMVMFSLWIHKFNVGREYLLVGDCFYFSTQSRGKNSAKKCKTVLKKVPKTVEE